MGIEIGISKLGMDERIEFFRTLSAWLVTGGGSMPVHEAISNTCEVFSREEYAALKGRMERVVREYSSGQVPFYRGLEIADLGFTRQEIAVIKASELSNQLRVAVPALVQALEMKHNAVKMLKRQLTMPIVGGFMLILMSLGVMIFMLPVVMGPVIERQADSLDGFPIIIRGYWGASVWLRANPYLVVAIASSPVILFFVRNTPWVRPYVERSLMGFKPTRRLIVAFNQVMVAYFMPALVRASLPLPAVLKTMADTTNNMQIASALRQAAYEHDHGYRLGDVLARLPFKGAFRSAVEAGEKTGKIAERVEDLQTPFKNEFDRISRRFVGALMMIVMIILLPFFIVSMYTSLAAPMIALMEYS